MMTSSLRAFAFNMVRDRFEPGDWWVQQDVDEFYHISPRQFVQRQLRPGETAVYNQHFEFRITSGEVQQWEAGDESVFDRRRPIRELRRFYNILVHSEPRMFQFRKNMQWGYKAAYPWNMGYVAAKRIAIRHYPHRDPVSLQARLILRNHLLPIANEQNWTHWAVKDWRSYIADDDSCELQYWQPGKDLPEVHREDHLRAPVVRMTQRAIHRILLPLFDLARPQYPESFKPAAIPAAINLAVIRELRALRNAGLDSLRG